MVFFTNKIFRKMGLLFTIFYLFRSACLLTEGLLRKPESYEIVANLSKKLNYLVEVLPGDLLSSALSDTLYYLSNTYYRYFLKHLNNLIMFRTIKTFVFYFH